MPAPDRALEDKGGYPSLAGHQPTRVLKVRFKFPCRFCAKYGRLLPEFGRFAVPPKLRYPVFT